MKETSYAYAVARIRALENSLLSKADTELLITASGMEECAAILEDKGYAGRENGLDFGAVFAEKMQETWHIIREIVPEPALFDLFLIKNDYHNLKAVMKGISSGKDYKPYLLFPGNVPAERLALAVSEGNFGLLSEMETAAREAFELLNKEGDSRAASVLLDKASQSAMLAAAEKTGSEFILSLVRLTVDASNVKTAARCAMMGKDTEFIQKTLVDASGLNVRELAAAAADLSSLEEFLQSTPFAEGAPHLCVDFSLFEKWCDDRIIRFLSGAKFKAFGPEPVAAYLFAREAEIKTVHIIVTGKANHLDEESIRRRVRTLYV